MFRPAPLPPNEVERLRALRGHAVVDTLAEQAFDHLADVASAVCGASVSLISLADGSRHWFRSSIGLEVRARIREFAAHATSVLGDSHVVVVPDAQADERLAVAASGAGQGLRFFAAAPLVSSDGDTLGMLSVLDNRPRRLLPDQVSALQMLAQHAVQQLELRRSLGELEEVIRNQARYIEQLEAHQQYMERNTLELVEENRRDALTGINNRRAFEDRLIAESSRSQRRGTPLALALIDVDHFKSFNDSFGHPAGDAVLREVADVLRGASRQYDFVARYGGEEFAVLFPATSLETAFAVSERFRRNVQRHAWSRREITISIGIAALNADVTTPEELLDRADRALYRAKSGGRNRVSLADPSEPNDGESPRHNDPGSTSVLSRPG